MNNLTIIGNLTRDPEMRTLNDGRTVCVLNVAVRRMKKDSGTDYFRVSVWGNMGNACCNYLSKGRKVAVQGSVSAHAYKNQQGEAVGSLEVFANNVEFLGGGNGGAAPAESAPAATDPSGCTPVTDDDLPF